jgi:BirA family biotin operon repressor/biotin-[acetyl-CoA-carboxylase] ligase
VTCDARTGGGALVWQLRRLQSAGDGRRKEQPDPTLEPEALAQAAGDGLHRVDAMGRNQARQPPSTPESRAPQPGAGVLPGAGWTATAPNSQADPQTESHSSAPIPWRLRTLPVCASTELELDRWLEQLVPDPEAPLPGPLAVIARRQRFGHGQQGRAWSSPAGGVWLSAALPWPADPTSAAAPGLAVAVGLALQLEALGLEVRLKWPNDLLLAGRDRRAAKLAGLLPGLRLRGGTIRWARVGLGLNGHNPVPPGATNLRHSLGLSQAQPQRLAAHVLIALEWAMAAATQPTWVRRQAEARLLVAPQSWQGAGDGWQPIGLADDGALVLGRGNERQQLHRRFD